VGVEGRLPNPSDHRGTKEAWASISSAGSVELLRRSLAGWGGEYELLVDSTVVAVGEWVEGRYPEFHLEAESAAGYVALRRLRPFILVGEAEDSERGTTGILHLGSAGQGLVEVGDRQFLRRTGVTGRQRVGDQEGREVLVSPGPAGRRVLLYESGHSDLKMDEFLGVLLIEAFCAVFTGRHMFRSLLTAWVRPPKMGVALSSLPKVARLSQGWDEAQRRIT